MDDRPPPETVDLSEMTIEDVRRVSNPVLRDALVAAKERLVGELANQSHVQHNQHTSHSNAV
jgi:hypothetical protein